MGITFGADGAAGIAFKELTCETAMFIGRAFAAVTGRQLSRKTKIIMARDTRSSSDALSCAFTAGLLSGGADVIDAGVVPTPAVSFLINETGADGGVMITAKGSAETNGIKLFSSSGTRLAEKLEEEIGLLADGKSGAIDTPAETGRLTHDDNAADRYVADILASGEQNFPGMKIAVDCANGCTSATAEKLFGNLGAKVYLLNCEPDGSNINLGCGTSDLRELINFVKEKNCDAGIAFDGEGSRCIAIDETGEVADGDKLTAIFAKDMNDRGVLADSTAVINIMTNLGFSIFARENGIKSVITRVGERYMTEQLTAGGYSLGGEQSGQIIFSNLSCCPDGQLTAIQLLSVMKRSGSKLSALASVMEMYPQVITNVRISPKWKESWKNIPEIEGIIERKEDELGSDGRVLVRESAGESVIRIMAEGKDLETAGRIALEIAEVIKKNCPK